MNETTQNSVSIDNLNAVCRICLNVSEDLRDILTSGINDKLTEITKVQVEIDDQLPKSICFPCNTELDHFFKFMEKVKLADSYLRTLFSNKEQEKQELMSGHGENLKRQSFKRGPKIKKLKNDKKMKKSEADDLYLIVVPEGASDETNITSEILIKQIDLNNENLNLSNICKSFVKNVSSCSNLWNFYTNDLSNNSDCSTNETGISVDKLCEKPNIFKCSECENFFMQSQELINHAAEFHNNMEINEHNFTNYVKNQKAEIMKTDIQEKKNLDINNCLDTNKTTRKIFLINLDDFTCKLCFEKIKSKSLITEHIQLYHSKVKIKRNHYINYICPICKRTFTDSEKDFTEHLFSHKKENIDFIRVGSLGEPLNTSNNETFTFISYEDAVTFLEVYNKSNKVFKICNMNSCDKCDYISESHEFLVNHYNVVHSDPLIQDAVLYCPVCLEKFYKNDCDNNKLEFYNHLKCHKNEGIYFVEVSKNNSILKTSSEIFCQSQLLLDLIDNSLVFNSNEIWNPNLEFSTEKPKQVNYTCDLCQKVFKKKKLILKHLKYHQTKKAESNLVCEKCGKTCSGKISYQKHFLKHLNTFESVKSRGVCNICQKTFANRATLNGHMRHHFKEGNVSEINSSILGIICEKCGKSFSNNSSLTKHKKIHMGGKENAVLKCEICSRNFLRQSSFDRHKSAHLNPKYVDCEVCKLPFPSALSLRKHSELHKNGIDTYDCKSCKLSFLTKESLSAHQIHAGHYQDREPLECNVCHEKFFIGKKFSEHIKTHPKYKMGQCTLCGKRLSTPQSLMLHMDRHFESNGILCPHCGKQFFEERNYRRHLLTHEGIKPFPCDVKGCEKSFYTLFELNRHKKYHYNKRDFACPYCSKCFHEANHLTIHVRTHTGERPYTCPHCNKGFITRTSCKQHIKLVHRGIGYDMILSNISKKVAVFDTVQAFA